MQFSGGLWAPFILVALVFPAASGDPLVPALFVFGDSIMDVGNNNHRLTVVRSNFLPYGRDFVNHKPTGRFCNGKMAIDFTAELMGFPSYQPAYLSQEAAGDNLLTGANFASAGSGFYDGTAQLYNTIPLKQQLKNYKEYQKKVVDMEGSEKANGTFSGGIHLLSAGSSDFLQNYYINPLLHLAYTTSQHFSHHLMSSFSTFIHNLYGLGARRIGVSGLPPLGCLPAAITLFGLGSNECVQRLNQDAIAFNNELNTTAQTLQNTLPGLKLVVFDVYNPLLDIVSKPSENGFIETRRACCGTGTFETSIFCNSVSAGTCNNATGYVFWDGFHPTEAANKLLADALISQGISLVS